jgi:RNA recognition motif-containing protein
MCCFFLLLILLPSAAQKAIREFNEAQFDGRVITVKLDRKAV